MDTLQVISAEIWGKDYSPSLESVEKADPLIQQIQFQDLLVYNFKTVKMTVIEQFFLATSKYWMNWNMDNWLSVFKKVQGNDLAEYHLTFCTCQYLGINPNFSSQANTVIANYSFTDNKMHTGAPNTFVAHMTGARKELAERMLDKYKLSIGDLEKLNTKLVLQGGDSGFTAQNSVRDLT